MCLSNYCEPKLPVESRVINPMTRPVNQNVHGSQHNSWNFWVILSRVMSHFEKWVELWVNGLLEQKFTGKKCGRVFVCACATVLNAGFRITYKMYGCDVDMAKKASMHTCTEAHAHTGLGPFWVLTLFWVSGPESQIWLGSVMSMKQCVCSTWVMLTRCEWLPAS